LHPEIFASASPIEMNAGGVPVGSSIPRLVDDGILIVGDAAHLASPIHGGGISNAILSARIASDVIVNALKREDLSAGSLRDYERRWRLVKGEESERLLKLRKDLERMEDEELNRLSESLSGEKILDLISGKHGTRLL
jgi:digeranylgeranylglycerophospholipid reductase